MRVYHSAALLSLFLLISTGSAQDRIAPWQENPFFWAYGGTPILLAGGSVEDNLFQIPDLEDHLDLLQSVGGNYVRCTMSSRDPGNVWAFARQDEDLYDLRRPNPEYWERFERLLEAAQARQIIVQIEVWATFDFYDGREMRRPYWQENPFNPKNNLNYSPEESGLPTQIPSHPTQTRNPFFRSVPDQQDNQVLLTFQKAFVDRLLEISLDYGNVLYCMDNETSVNPDWGAFWARYIRQRARERGLTVQTTEMWDPWDLSHPMHSYTFENPEIYSFVDISQNNHNSGDEHWENLQKQRRRILDSGTIRPMNNVKIYGADGGRFGSSRDGLERFWRNLFGGSASARFHRPDSGVGLNSLAQTHLWSFSLLSREFDFTRAEPSNHLLTERDENEAFCSREEEGSLAIFFPEGGSVELVSGALEALVEVRWLNIQESRWHPAEIMAGNGLEVTAPGEGFWVVMLRQTSRQAGTE